ncbi:MAG: hypothetical protein K2X98_01395 [Alphaproteobacteria bacterium]|nr:hypothetical protein [Alphaproteobacteria bacterium]
MKKLFYGIICGILLLSSQDEGVASGRFRLHGNGSHFSLGDLGDLATKIHDSLFPQKKTVDILFTTPSSNLFKQTPLPKDPPKKHKHVSKKKVEQQKHQLSQRARYCKENASTSCWIHQPPSSKKNSDKHRVKEVSAMDLVSETQDAAEESLQPIEIIDNNQKIFRSKEALRLYRKGKYNKINRQQGYDTKIETAFNDIYFSHYSITNEPDNVDNSNNQHNDANELDKTPSNSGSDDTSTLSESQSGDQSVDDAGMNAPRPQQFTREEIEEMQKDFDF